MLQACLFASGGRLYKQSSVVMFSSFTGAIFIYPRLRRSYLDSMHLGKKQVMIVVDRGITQHRSNIRVMCSCIVVHQAIDESA